MKPLTTKTFIFDWLVIVSSLFALFFGVATIGFAAAGSHYYPLANQSAIIFGVSIITLIVVAVAECHNV